MIYTITVNPSLDYIVSVDDFKLGLTNRTSSEKLLPGGKGINVSQVLMNLGVENTALGFVAGFTGDALVRELERRGIRQEFIRIDKGMTRINVKLKSIDGTEINGQGPDIGEADLERMMKRLDELQDNDVLFLAGSIPGSISSDLYRNIMLRLQKKNILFVVDATRELLTNVLEFHPFLIKPNNHELGEIFGVELNTRESVVPYARKLQEMGARNVLVSMAGEGSVLVAEDNTVVSHEAPKGVLVNGVGAGDSMVAGFMAGYMKTGDYEYAYKMGASAGSASAFSEDLATEEEIMKVMQDNF
ncbi:MAG: 1-phosphofructokinase [Lachnospiraceae bacterium]|nr:1-phosphofructokinase [Lachnospiraceae bacterium]